MRRETVVLAILGIVAAAGCAAMKKLPQEPGFHPRLTPTAYIEEGKLLALVVDTEAARYRENAALVPLAILVANKNLDKLALTRESFTLVDDRGAKYPLATVNEARSLSPMSAMDWRVSRAFFNVVASPYSDWPYGEMNFFPTTSGSRARVVPPRSPNSLLRDDVELGRHMWSTDILYFPHPEGSLKNRKFELWLATGDLPDPVFVKFAFR